MYFNQFEEVEVLFGYRSGDNGTVMSTRTEGVKQFCEVRFSNYDTYEYVSDDLCTYYENNNNNDDDDSCVFGDSSNHNNNDDENDDFW